MHWEGLKQCIVRVRGRHVRKGWVLFVTAPLDNPTGLHNRLAFAFNSRCASVVQWTCVQPASPQSLPSTEQHWCA
jgi:hypothetical protein